MVPTGYNILNLRIILKKPFLGEHLVLDFINNKLQETSWNGFLFAKIQNKPRL